MGQNNPATKHWVIIPAAGLGMRMGGITPKQYLPIADEPIIARTINTWLSHKNNFTIVVVLHPEDEHFVKMNLSDERIITTTGGTERCDSVASGLHLLEGKANERDWVLVHDAARPCLTHDDIDRLLNQIADHDVGGLLAIPVRDCLKEVNDNAEVVSTMPRANVWQAQTPQMFRFGLLSEALVKCAQSNRIVLDESEAIEALGYKPLVVAGNMRNIKITHPEDMQLAEVYCESVVS